MRALRPSAHLICRSAVTKMPTCSFANVSSSTSGTSTGWAVSNMLESTVEALAEPLVGEESSLTAQRVVSAKHTTALALLALGAVATLAWAVFLGWLVGRLFRFWWGVRPAISVVDRREMSVKEQQ